MDVHLEKSHGQLFLYRIMAAKLCTQGLKKAECPQKKKGLEGDRTCRKN